MTCGIKWSIALHFSKYRCTVSVTALTGDCFYRIYDDAKWSKVHQRTHFAYQYTLLPTPSQYKFRNEYLWQHSQLMDKCLFEISPFVSSTFTKKPSQTTLIDTTDKTGNQQAFYASKSEAGHRRECKTLVYQRESSLAGPLWPLHSDDGVAFHQASRALSGLPREVREPLHIGRGSLFSLVSLYICTTLWRSCARSINLSHVSFWRKEVEHGLDKLWEVIVVFPSPVLSRVGVIEVHGPTVGNCLPDRVDIIRDLEFRHLLL